MLRIADKWYKFRHLWNRHFTFAGALLFLCRYLPFLSLVQIYCTCLAHSIFTTDLLTDGPVFASTKYLHQSVRGHILSAFISITKHLRSELHRRVSDEHMYVFDSRGGVSFLICRLTYKGIVYVEFLLSIRKLLEYFLYPSSLTIHFKWFCSREHMLYGAAQR